MRPITRPQLMLLLAGLGLAVALAPQLVIPRYGMTGYLMFVGFVVVVLAALARPTGRR